MLRALVELGKQLELEDKLPPVGFYHYGQPIKWTVHVWRDPNKADITENDGLMLPRPYSGRTSGVQPHPVVDEAAYALAVSKRDDGSVDRRADEKHAAFLSLLQKAMSSAQNSDAKEALSWVNEVLEKGLLKTHPRFPEISAKDWVSFMPEEGPLRGRHLFEHDDLRAFWIERAQELVAQRDKAGRTITGECAICSETRPLIRMIPLNAKLTKASPIHSLNASAFVSFTTTDKGAHIGLCFECADTATRAFNYLSSEDSASHRKDLIRDKQSSDSLKNQIALFWLKAPEASADLEVGARTLTLDDMALMLSQPLLESSREEDDTPVASLPQLRELLDLPWKPRLASLRLDDYRFYLAVLSPNVGRIAVREWIDVSLANFKVNLARYLDAVSIVYPFGGNISPVTVKVLFDALTPPRRKAVATNPAVLRNLLRCAYLGHVPPAAILNMAVQRFRVPTTHDDAWRLHALAAAMKLVLTYGKEEARTMQELDESRESESPAHLYGRQFAIVERAQELSQWFEENRRGGSPDKARKGTNVMLVERYYGGASSTPGTVMPQLYRLFETAYLPKIRRERRSTYEYLRGLMAEVSSKLDAIPGKVRQRSLSPQEQAEFALGFYSQRARFRKGHVQENSVDIREGEEE